MTYKMCYILVTFDIARFLKHKCDINDKQENTCESPTERSKTTTYKLVSHPPHDCKRKVTVDPSMGLPLSDTGRDAVPTTYMIEELLGCRAKGA